MLVASQSSAGAPESPGNSCAAKQAHTDRQDSAHGAHRQSSCCALLPADMTCAGSFSSSSKKARKDEVKFLLKASGTCSCLPDAPSQVSTGLIMALFGVCPECPSPTVDEIFHYFYAHLALIIFSYK